SAEPAHSVALSFLGLEPILEVGMRLGEGTGALTALPVLRAGVATMCEMATFADSGVSDKD
ncbi:nicotinate-nucleotide--dimethylbenzimidazole phosphoribosyltransferase, partial [Dietzia sp.]|uniref:nicotinate-nucleotide--dimethylbenzimidazole phosphoribosyltransferase n=1 Tax=Dietzia sp. TaxID=1871616 RepID=UPI002FDB3E68